MLTKPALGAAHRSGASTRTAIVILSLIAFAGATGCATINLRLAMNQGVNFYKAKEYEKAVESFQKAIAIDPGYAEAHLDLGLTYMEMYEPGSEHPKDLEYSEGAIQAFKKYIQLDPSNEKGREYLINVCTLSHRMQDAIDFFMADYAKDPNNLNLVKMLATLYRMKGDMESAIEWYEKAAALEPDNPEAYYSVGVACWGRSYNSQYLDYETRMILIDEGVESLQHALDLKKDYYEALTYLSLLYREKAKYDISPAQAESWRLKADELLARALEIRNKALAEQAAEAAKASGDTPAPSTTQQPGSSTGGE